MQVVTDIHLLRNPYTVFYISDEAVALSHQECYKSLGVSTCDTSETLDDEFEIVKRKGIKLVTNAFFLKPFVKECLNSAIYRINVVSHLNKISRYPANGVVFLKLILEPPDKEIIDYAWNEKMLRLVWTKVEIENAFSWLSTLGGAYSALGDYFENCAEEAGRISIRQYKLSKMLGDDGLAARSKLYSALSLSQKGKLKLSRRIVRNVAAFGHATHDKRLVRMCQGVWAKLKYLQSLKKPQGNERGNGNGRVVK